MTPAARAAAAIGILDAIRAGQPAEAALIGWARASRFAGSGDRAAVRDLVFETLRRMRTRAALGGGEDGRALILGGLRETGTDAEAIFTGQGHAPPPLTDAERMAGRAPTEAEAHDLPDWLTEPLSADLGLDFPAIAAALRDRAPVWLRVNLARGDVAGAQASLTTEGIETEADPRCPTALRVTAGERRVQASRAYQDGLVELQDLSPQMACAELAVSPGETALDYCAGGGGKALALAAAGARVTAWDAAPQRLRDLPARAARAGARIAVAPRTGPQGRFDLVVADVPCSGSGTWRRTPDAKWRLTPQALAALHDVQAQILTDAAAHVLPGGRLAYMTCSLLRSENQAQIVAFLAANPGFQQVSARSLTPLDASDGFFVAVLQSLTPA